MNDLPENRRTPENETPTNQPGHSQTTHSSSKVTGTPTIIRRSVSRTPVPIRPKVRVSVSAPQSNVVRVARKERPATQRLGEPDFSRSIITGNQLNEQRRRHESSPAQKLFFDAAIAVVSISFMILTLVNL